MTTAQPAQKARREYNTSGLYRLKNTVNKLGTRLIDRRYKVGRELAKWRADLLLDLGGESALSTQEKLIVDLCVRSKLLIDSIDAWLLQQKNLINTRKRTLIGVVKERQSIADGLTKNLQVLGLKRIPKPTQSLDDYIAEKYGGRTDETNGSAAQAKPGSTDGDPDDQEAQPEADNAVAPNGARVAGGLIVR